MTGEHYIFAVHETKTHEVMDDVRNFKSEIGILYLNDFNRKVLTKLFECGMYVYMWKGNPLAGRQIH